MNKERLIKLENVSFAYPSSQKNVLDHVDFELFQGDRIGMIAPNGSGKTTLLHVMMGLCRPDEGRIELFGEKVSTEKEFARLRTRIGLMFQDADDQLFNPYVIDDVAFGPLNLGYSPEQALRAARETLELLGISDFERSIVHRLSGGEKRLVALASVLAMKPQVLLLDEPTSGLDSAVKERIESVLSGLDISYLVISHEFDFISKVCSGIYSIKEGRLLKDEDLHIHRHEHVHKMGRLPHTHL